MSQIFWTKKPVRLTADITGKNIGDSVPAGISAMEVIKLSQTHEIFLAIKMGEIEAVTSTYYYQGADGLAQVVFLPGLPEIDGTHLTALILSDNEYTIIGVQEG